MRYSANNRASIFLKEHNDELMLIPFYAEIKDAFNAEMNKIADAHTKQAKKITHIAQTKKRLRLQMALTMVKYLQRACVQAYNINNLGLAKQFSVGKTYFTRGKDSAAAPKARNLLNVIIKNHSELTIITDDDLLEMETTIKKYEDHYLKPKMAINERQVKGTSLIPGILNNLDFLKAQIKKLIQSYAPHLAPTWIQINKVGHSTGVRHLSLVLIVTDAATDVLLRNIKCTVSNHLASFVKYTTRRGSARFKSLQNSGWTITFEAKNYETHILNNVITEVNQITRLHIPLVKINSA